VDLPSGFSRLLWQGISQASLAAVVVLWQADQLNYLQQVLLVELQSAHDHWPSTLGTMDRRKIDYILKMCR